ncbi:MAG: alpha/beta fold hydrolase, partial [Eubacteriaceae bacterium]|nr:alpha/beta fold hydrolase [Eubacteriaceae bacterium]
MKDSSVTREFRMETGDGAMNVIVFGKGDIPLVVIPGLRTSSLEGTSMFLSAYYHKFKKHFRTYILDVKEPVKEGSTIAGMAKDALGALDQLGVGDFMLYGISMGGMIAQQMAAASGGRVKKLLLALTACRANDTVRDAVGTWISQIERGDIKGFIADYSERGYSEAYRRKHSLLLKAASAGMKVKDTQRFLMLCRAILSFDGKDDLRRISCPVTVIGAEKDRVVSGEASLELAEALGCGCHMYPDLSHEAYNEA